MALLARGAAAQDSVVPQPDGAERESLFARHDVLALTISGDFRTLTRDRDSTTARYHPVTLRYTGSDGQAVTVQAETRTRGVWRRASRNCSFPPLRVRVPRESARGTIFRGHRNLKLVTHCQRSADYEQYVLQEYLLYRVYNLLTPYSFQARLAHITYSDARDGASTTRYGILLEDDDALARRSDAVVLEATGGLYHDFDPDQTAIASAFQYMIGNTDFSLAGLHNMKILGLKAGMPIPVPYDFDFAGAVGTRYATPDPKLGIRTVRQRLYRGICRTEAEWGPIIARFNAQRDSIVALYTGLAPLDRRISQRALSYFDEFYQVVNDRRLLRREIIDRCLPGA